MDLKLEDVVSFFIDDRGIPISSGGMDTDTLITAKIIALYKTSTSDMFCIEHTYNKLCHLNGPLNQGGLDYWNAQSQHYKYVPNIKDYFGKEIAWIHSKFATTNSVTKALATNSKANDFCQCGKCSDWVFMAGPNQKDGSFICYLCTQDPFRCSTLS